MSYNAYVSLLVCLLFHEETVLVQEAEEAVTLLRETEIYLLFLKLLVIPPLMLYLENADARYTVM